MMKKLHFLIAFISLSTITYSQCTSVAQNTCSQSAPTIISNSISCTTTNNNGGRRNFQITNMIAGATYRVSNCGSGLDTQMTIRNAGGVSVAYNDDDGPGCLGTAASIDFTPPTTGNYRVQVNKYNCATTPNTSNGDIVVTLLSHAPAPLSNDEPCTATPLTVNNGCIYSGFTNANATGSTGIPAPVCGGYSGGDVWFSVTVPSSGAIVIDTDSGDITDSGMAIYSGTICSNLALVECDDDDSNNGLMSSITLTGRTPGETLYIRFWEYGNDNNGTFSICAIEPPSPPVNDECSGAIPLSPNSICNYSFYDNTSATSSSGVTDPGCAFYSGGDVWFSVIIDSTGEVTIDTQTSSITDSGMALYSGNCGSLTLIECDDDDSPNGTMSLITLTGRTPGETIYIRFWEFGNDNQGTFGICATSPIPPNVYGVHLPCPGNISQPLTSTIGCQGALSIGNTINGSLNAATDNVALQPLIFISSADPCEFDTTDTANYTSINFTVDTTGTYTFAAETPVPYFDCMGYIYETASGFVPGTCSAGYIAGDDDDGPVLDPLVTANLTAGLTYTLVTTKFAFGSTTHTGSFTWNVTGPPRDIDWYTSPTGGSPIGSGSSFDPVGIAGSPLTDTNTPGIYSFWGACPNSPGTRLQADYIIGKIWMGNTDNNWYNETNWLPDTVPTASDCVLIPDIAISNFDEPIADIINLIPLPPQPAYALNLTVAPTANLEVGSETALVVTDWVHLDGTIDIRDSGSLIQITDGATNVNNNTGNGTINMQRTATIVSSYDYIYWSSPVEGFGVSNVSPGSTLIYEWIPTIAGNGAGNYGNWQATTENMINGKGYIIRNVVGTPTPSTPEFIGKPNNGIITKAITRGTYTAGDYLGGGTTIATRLDDNWNLIGNPYPSAISADTFIATNAAEITDDIDPSISGTVYLWRHLATPSNAINDPFYEDFVYNYNPNDYIAYNTTGSNPSGFGGHIVAGQSFFVLMEDTAPVNSNVTFNNTMRNATLNNSQFYRESNEVNRDSNIEKHRIWLDLISPNNTANSILIGYVAGATNNLDRLYDGFELSETSTRFYSIIETEAFGIQGKALPFQDTDTVPLGIVIPENGNYSIAINTLDGLFQDTNQAIFIEDTYTNIIHNLRVNPYSFNINTGTYNDRFILRYTDNALSIEDYELSGLEIIAPSNSYIKVKSGNNNISTVIVYDLLGRVLINKTEINASEIRINNPNFSEGTYMVKAILSSGKQKIQKVVLKH